nr:PREDICTED: uncharacterized protein LOC105679011 [Linepithema humile]XP_012234202.1 PREDICTED: uncharacterized protein LOC105679011 [Linepithema humile]
MSRVKISKDNVWDHFEKILEQNFRAWCKICELSFLFVDLQCVVKHFGDKHNEDFISLATKKRREMPKMYFDKYVNCLVCGTKLLFQNYHNHLCQHSTMVLAYYEMTRNKREYYIQTGDFTIKCKIVNCGKIITLPLSKTIKNYLLGDTHLKKLRNMQTDAMSMPLTIKEKRELLREKYVILRCFQAKCKSCKFQDYYIDTTNFSQHVNERHADVALYERKCGEGWPWMCFKYYALSTSICIICKTVLPYYSELLINHLHYQHFMNTRDYYHHDLSWVWKYCNASGDFEVRCNLCTAKISLDVKSHFNHHTHHFKDTRWQKLTSTAGPSGSQPN